MDTYGGLTARELLEKRRWAPSEPRLYSSFAFGEFEHDELAQDFYDAMYRALAPLLDEADALRRRIYELEAEQHERDLYRAAVSVLVEDLGGEITIPQRHLEESAALDEVEYRASDDQPSDGPDVTFRIIVREVRCKTCDGRGELVLDGLGDVLPCPDCNGTGEETPR